MAWSLKKPLWLSSLILSFFLSAGSLAYGWWLLQIEQGHRALRQGDSARAAEIFIAAEAPLRRFRWLRWVLQLDYQDLVSTEVSLLYASGQIEEAIHKLEEVRELAPSLAESGQYSFWAGNVLMRQAAQSGDPEVVMNSLKAALAEYQKGLAARPDDWDLKYNYEVARLILSQKHPDKKQEEEKVKSILDKMRPKDQPSREELPVEKRG